MNTNQQERKRKTAPSSSSENTASSSESFPTERACKTSKISIVPSNFNENPNQLQLLPNEMILHILSFLVGDHQKNSKMDVSTIPALAEKAENERYFKTEQVSEKALVFIPPFENVVSLVRFTKVNKQFYQMITQPAVEHDEEGVTDFEEHWLNGYNFFSKLLYWIRTRNLERLELSTGDMNSEEFRRLAKAQNIIQHVERGMAMKSFEDAFESDNCWLEGLEDDQDDDTEQDDDTDRDDDTEQDDDKYIYKKIFKSQKPIYSDEKESQEGIRARLAQLEISIEKYCSHYRTGDNDAFTMFLVVSLMLSLNMFNTMDSEERDLYSSGSQILLSKCYLENWSFGEELAGYSKREKKSNQQQTSPSIGISIKNPGAWARFATNNHKDFTFEEIANLQQVDTESMLKKLSKSIFLHLENVVFFKPLQNFEFPNSIMFLSLDLTSTKSHSIYPENEWNDFLNGCTFPGVRYLRLRFDCYNTWWKPQEDENLKALSSSDYQKLVLKAVLNKERFPNLQYLTFNGFNEIQTIHEHHELLDQLLGIEFSFNNDSRDNTVWKQAVKITSQLSGSDMLKYAVVETELDPRRVINIDGVLENFYSLHRCPASIGYASISRFYYISGE